MNPIFEAYRQSDLFGKAIFIALLGLSIITWAIWLKKWLYFREISKNGKNIHQTFEKRRHQPLTLDFPLSHHPFSTVYTAIKAQTIELLNKNRGVNKEEKGVTLSRSDIELIDASLTPTLSSQVKGLERSLFILSTVVSLAPFLGLLGTVWGILLTFSHLQQGAASHAMVMNGLAMALGTTVVGLLVAIPALIAYNIIKAGISDFNSDIEDFSRVVLSSIEIHYRKVE
jgi:biopolymer transport protein TolQ